MASGLSIHRRLPFSGDFPAEAQETARQAAAWREAAADTTVSKRENILGAAADTARRRMADTLGAENSRELRTLMRAASLSWRDLLQPPGRLKVDYAAANIRRRMECAPVVGQDQAAVLTGARALRSSNWMGLR